MNIEQISNEELENDLSQLKNFVIFSVPAALLSFVIIYLDFIIVKDKFDSNDLDFVFYLFFAATVYLTGMTIKFIPRIVSMILNMLFISSELNRRRQNDSRNN